MHARYVQSQLPHRARCRASRFGVTGVGRDDRDCPRRVQVKYCKIIKMSAPRRPRRFRPRRHGGMAATTRSGSPATRGGPQARRSCARSRRRRRPSARPSVEISAQATMPLAAARLWARMPRTLALGPAGDTFAAPGRGATGHLDRGPRRPSPAAAPRGRARRTASSALLQDGQATADLASGRGPRGPCWAMGARGTAAPETRGREAKEGARQREDTDQVSLRTRVRVLGHGPAPSPL